MPLGGWYHASKFGLEGYSDSLRMEVEQFGIDVVVIEPGGIQTEWGDIADEQPGKDFRQLRLSPAHRRCQPHDRPAEDNNKMPSPVVIAELISKVLMARKPKTRYVTGYMAGMVLFMKRWLSDRLFDRLTSASSNKQRHAP